MAPYFICGLKGGDRVLGLLVACLALDIFEHLDLLFNLSLGEALVIRSVPFDLIGLCLS
jgi:hypothetical protein